jgi:hypothetical protein
VSIFIINIREILTEMLCYGCHKINLTQVKIYQ